MAGRSARSVTESWSAVAVPPAAPRSPDELLRGSASQEPVGHDRRHGPGHGCRSDRARHSGLHPGESICRDPRHELLHWSSLTQALLEYPGVGGENEAGEALLAHGNWAKPARRGRRSWLPLVLAS